MPTVGELVNNRPEEASMGLRLLTRISLWSEANEARVHLVDLGVRTLTYAVIVSGSVGGAQVSWGLSTEDDAVWDLLRRSLDAAYDELREAHPVQDDDFDIASNLEEMTQAWVQEQTWRALLRVDFQQLSNSERRVSFQMVLGGFYLNESLAWVEGEPYSPTESRLRLLLDQTLSILSGNFLRRNREPPFPSLRAYPVEAAMHHLLGHKLAQWQARTGVGAFLADVEERGLTYSVTLEGRRGEAGVLWPEGADVAEIWRYLEGALEDTRTDLRAGEGGYRRVRGLNVAYRLLAGGDPEMPHRRDTRPEDEKISLWDVISDQD